MTFFRLIALAWTAFILIYIPLRSQRGGVKVFRAVTHRASLYVRTAIGLLWLGAVTLYLDWVGERVAIGYTVATLSGPALIWWTIGILTVALAVWFGTLLVHRRAGRPLDATLFAMLPVTVPEHIAFAGLSIVAGVVEEFTYRAFCYGALTFYVDLNPWLAMGIVTVGFGAGHLYQGAAGARRTAIYGVVVGIPVVLSGSIVPSMIVHATIDLTSGLFMRPLAEHWGLAATAADREPTPL